MRLFSRWRCTGIIVTCSTGTSDHAVTEFLPCVHRIVSGPFRFFVCVPKRMPCGLHHTRGKIISLHVIVLSYVKQFIPTTHYSITRVTANLTALIDNIITNRLTKLCSYWIVSLDCKVLLKWLVNNIGYCSKKIMLRFNKDMFQQLDCRHNHMSNVKEHPCNRIQNKPLNPVPKTLFITMTSYWERWRLKSPASRLFTQPFIQKQIKENIKAPRHWPFFAGNSPVPGEFSAQMASNAENVSIWWRHHVNSGITLSDQPTVEPCHLVKHD